MNPPDWTGRDDDAQVLTALEATLSPERRWALFLESRERFTRLAFQLLDNAEDAEDVMQEVGLRVLRHRTGPRDEASFQAWCRALLRNSAVDHRRHARRRPLELVGNGIDEYGVPVTAVDPMLASERRLKLEQQLHELDTSSYQVLVRRYVLGQTATEIASDLRSSPAGVRMKLKRLRTKLRRLLPNLGAIASAIACDPVFAPLLLGA